MQGWMCCQTLRQYFIIYSSLIIKSHSTSVNTQFVPVRQYYEQILHWSSVPLGISKLKPSGTCKQMWHFHPEGVLTLNISTDRCSFLMQTNHGGTTIRHTRGARAVATKTTSVMSNSPARQDPKDIKSKSKLRPRPIEYASTSNKWTHRSLRTIINCIEL